MILALHIFTALASFVLTSYLCLRPARQGLYANYAFILTTLGTGTYLAWHAQSHMLESCALGLGYVIIVTSGVLVAHHRLAVATSGANATAK